MSPASSEAINVQPDRDALHERVLILAPIGRDGPLAAAALHDGGIEERDQFLAMLGHELRNPLAAITLAIESLRLDAHDITHEILIRQTKHLKQLVDDLLEIGRITSGKIALHRAEVDFGDVVEHCVESMRARATAHRLHLTLARDGE